MRVFLIVIDSFGIGALPDAALYGDEGSDTYGNIVRATGLKLPWMVSLGLNNIDGVSDGSGSLSCVAKPRAAFGRMSEKTPAKDTTAGHYELAGLVLEKPYRVYKSFPVDVVEQIERAAGVRFIGNEAASGTEIIARLGPKHLETGCPILYTSQDSVLQIAADTSVFPLEKLYDVCEIARSVMVGDRAVGRVIARPFVHKDGKFTRTEDRRDYALEPPGETMLDKLSQNGILVTAVGKIKDIFCGRGIARSIHTGNNGEGLAAVRELMSSSEEGLVFVNLVDTDMLYGHRNDAEGYASALIRIDSALRAAESLLRKDDVLIVTADHGCDPTTPSTDHSREYVPLLIFGDRIFPISLGTLNGFDNIADFVLFLFGVQSSSLIAERLHLAASAEKGK